MVSCNIAKLRSELQGRKEEFSFNEPLDAGDGLTLATSVSGKARLLKLAHELNVQLTNLEAGVDAVCSRCLRNFREHITVPFAEREFIIDLDPDNVTKDEDVFFMDAKGNELVLDEMIRQELLLHFPVATVCSEGCKGLCAQCGVNKNETTCNCVAPAPKNTFQLTFNG